MSYPNTIDPEKFYHLKVGKRVKVLNAVLSPRDQHLVRGTVLQALVDQDEDAIVLAVEA